MVVCKCRKATRIYCFVHKAPVCGECVCHPEHQICVVKKYSEWVVDGEYDWPPTCSLCHVAVESGTVPRITRLGCLHIIHTDCLVSHIQSFPPDTAPAGYVCPKCSSPIWPPKSIKDTGSQLHSKLKESIILSGLEKNVFGNHLVTFSSAESRATIPPAFDSDPLVRLSSAEDDEKNNASVFNHPKNQNFLSSAASTEEKTQAQFMSTSRPSDSEIVEIGPSLIGSQFTPEQDANSMKSTSPVGPGTTTRKAAHLVDRQNSETSYYADDEDGTHKKYNRRGTLRHKFLRLLLPFWSNKLPILPVTAPPRKDSGPKDEVPEGRIRHQKSSRMDPRKLLLILAIMACMATMGILYYRLAQPILSDNMREDDP